MANLQRHPSLRFSVFELASDIGLEAGAFDGNFDTIAEEEEPQVCAQTAGHSISSTMEELTMFTLDVSRKATNSFFIRNRLSLSSHSAIVKSCK